MFYAGNYFFSVRWKKIVWNRRSNVFNIRHPILPLALLHAWRVRAGWVWGSERRSWELMSTTVLGLWVITGCEVWKFQLEWSADKCRFLSRNVLTEIIFKFDFLPHLVLHFIAWFSGLRGVYVSKIYRRRICCWTINNVSGRRDSDEKYKQALWSRFENFTWDFGRPYGRWLVYRDSNGITVEIKSVTFK